MPERIAAGPRGALSGVLCAGLLVCFTAIRAESPPQEMARLDIVSLPQASAALASFGEAVAPKFTFSILAGTAFLSMTPPAMLLDVTKPFSIVFYAGGMPQLRFCIVGQARANISLPETETIRSGSLKMSVEPTSGNGLIFRSAAAGNVSPKPFTPEADQAAAVEIHAAPALLRRQFTLASLASENARAVPKAADDFLSSFRDLTLTLGMPRQNRIALKLTGTLYPGSPLPRYLANSTPPPAVSAFAGARELFVLNIPADRAFRARLLPLLPRFRNGDRKQETLRTTLIHGSSGRIAVSLAFRADPSATEKRPLAKAVFGLEQNAVPAVQKALESFPETPFEGLRIIAREKTPSGENVLFARMEKNEAVFYFCGLVQAELQTLLKAKHIALNQKEPFAAYDLSSGQRMISLQCRGDQLCLTLDADREFFRQFPPLIDKPIHALQPDRRKNPGSTTF